MKAVQTTRKATPFLIAMVLVMVVACVAAITFAFTALANDESDTDAEEVLIIEPTADAAGVDAEEVPELIADEAAEVPAEPIPAEVPVEPVATEEPVGSVAAEEPAVEDAVPDVTNETVPAADESYKPVAEDVEDTPFNDISAQEVISPYGAVAIDADDTIDIDVTIVWNDGNNRDGRRPELVTVQLWADGDPLYEITLEGSNEEDTWTGTFTDLPVYDESGTTEIVYTIEELEEVPYYYDTTIEGSAENGFTIINTHEIERRNVLFNVRWNDNDDQDGIRPESLTVILLDNDEIAYEVEITADDEWSGYFTGIIWYENHGSRISYLASEIMPDGYDCLIMGDAGSEFEIINRHTPENYDETGELTVTIEWDDADNLDGIRDSYEITLIGTINGDEGEEIVYTTSQTLSADQDSYTFTGLYKYSSGSEIVYTVEETLVPAGYAATVDGFTITNHELFNGDGMITVTKVWDDEENRDGIRDSYTVTLTGTADGEEVVSENVILNADQTSYTFTGQYKYYDGTEIEYSIAETDVPASYELTSIEGTAAEGFTITNTHDPERTDITVTKVWNDDNDRDGLRGDYTITLIGIANGITDSMDVTLTADQTSYTFTGQYKYYDGTEIEFSIDETDVPDGYELTSITGTAAEGFTITNTHEPEMVNGDGTITVTKIWNDDDDRDGIRGSYEVTLTGIANGEQVVSESQTLTADETSYTFTGLYKNADDTEIEYSINETVVPEGYELTAIEGTTAEGFTITNTHEPELIDISVTKVWNDDNDRDDIRGDYTITLIGTVYGITETMDVTLTADETSYTFTGLYKNAGGAEIQYSIAETDVPEGYEATVEGTAAEGFTITNSHEPAMANGNGEITVTKVWNDDNDRDGLRDSYTVTLTGTADDEVVVSEDVTLTTDETSYTFTGLYKNADGIEIEYNIAETVVPEGYELTSIEGSVTEGFIITNTHEIELLNGDGVLNVSKQWDDNDDALGVRPDSVTVQLLANGEPVEGTTLSLTADNGWSGSFSDLPANENGSAIEYSATETDPISYYELSAESVTSDEGIVSLVLTNALTLSFSPLDEEIVPDESDPDSWVKQESVNEYNAIEFEMSTMLPAVAGTDLLAGDFTLLFHDQLQSGLMLDASDPDFRVTVGGQAISSQYYTIEILTSDTSTLSVLAVPADDCSFHVTVDLSALYADGVITDEDLTGNTEVSVYFFADLEGTDINGSFTSTTWYQVYSGDTVLYTSDTDVVEVYTFEIIILKYDATTLEGTDYADSGLAGATLGVFYDEDCTNAVQRNGADFRVVSGDDGYAVFNGLAEGTYYVRELAAPDGYELSDEVVEVTLSRDLTDNIYSLTFANTAEGSEPEPEPEPIPPEPAETIDVTVSMVWEDNDNAADARPDLVVVVLMKNGKATTETLILNEENSWTATFKGLEAYTDGEENVYTIAEVTIPYYTTTITGDQQSGFTVTSIFVADEGYIDGGNDGNGGNSGTGGNGGNNGNNGNSGTGTTGGTGNGGNDGITQTGQNDLPIAPLAASAAVFLAAGVTALVIWRRRAA